jgi:uncharacterized membrane protein
MTYAGAVVLFLAAAFFIKYAFDSGWIGPTARVALGFAAGVALVVAGDHFTRRKMATFGQGLLGLGLALLFLSIFAAHGFYHLIERELAFGGFVAVAALGMTLAVVRREQAIAVLATLGALLTPILVSTGVDARDALFSYLTLLALATLGVAYFRRWRVLDTLTYAGVFGLYAGWYAEFYTSAAWAPALAWLAVFYVVFLPLPFLHDLRKSQPIGVDRFVMALVNALVFFGFAYDILSPERKFALGFVALAMAACYLAFGVVARKRVTSDVKSLFGFITLAVGFLTMAVPLQLKMQGITLAWAIEGPALCYLGYRFRYRPLRLGSLAIILLAAVRLSFEHWPLHHDPFVLFFNVHFGGAICVPLAAFAYAYLHRRFANIGTVEDRWAGLGAAIGGGFLALIIVDAEVSDWCTYAALAAKYSPRLYGDPASTAIWAIGAAAYVWLGWARRSTPYKAAALCLAAVALLIGFGQYFHEPANDWTVFLNWRFAAMLTGLAALMFYIVRAGRSPEIGQSERTVALALFGAWTVLLWLALGVEVYAYGRSLYHANLAGRTLGQTLLSVIWGVYAIALLLVGFWRRWRAYRLGALGLFALTLVKLVVLDMAELAAIYRIVAFFALGVLMIGASYLYHRVEQRLGATAASEGTK